MKDLPVRIEKFRTLVETQGGTAKSAYWTLGSYDLVVTVEGTEEAAMTTSQTVGSLGNLRTQTLRGFFAEEMKSLTCNMP